MKKSLLTFGRLVFLALPLTLAVPASAENASSQKPGDAVHRGHQKPERGGLMGYGCHMFMQPEMQHQNMKGSGEGMMGPGQGMMNQGQGPGQGMMRPGQGMMGPGQGMMDPSQGTWMQEHMKPSPQDSAEMAQLKQEILAQHDKLMADRTQMRADCQRMHELFLRMKQLRPGKKGPQTPTTKGNAAPNNPTMD